MVQLNLDNIFVKYVNSSEQWLLAIPVVENGNIKLRCFMRSRKDLVGVFTNCYTYNVSFSCLTDFFSYKSHGQAYNELIKCKKIRTGFFNEADHEKGLWKLGDIKETILNGRTELVLEAINHLMNLTNRGFVLEAITEAEKRQRQIEKEKVAQLEAELLDMGYDY